MTGKLIKQINVKELAIRTFSIDLKVLSEIGSVILFFLSSFQLSMEIQCSLADHILSFVKSERNRQIMCEGGLVSTLLTHCRSILLFPKHHLHPAVMRIFEKLSSQAISHSEFRLGTAHFWRPIFECLR